MGDADFGMRIRDTLDPMVFLLVVVYYRRVGLVDRRNLRAVLTTC